MYVVLSSTAECWYEMYMAQKDCEQFSCSLEYTGTTLLILLWCSTGEGEKKKKGFSGTDASTARARGQIISSLYFHYNTTWNVDL